MKVGAEKGVQEEDRAEGRLWEKMAFQPRLSVDILAMKAARIDVDCLFRLQDILWQFLLMSDGGGGEKLGRRTIAQPRHGGGLFLEWRPQKQICFV